MIGSRHVAPVASRSAGLGLRGRASLPATRCLARDWWTVCFVVLAVVSRRRGWRVAEGGGTPIPRRARAARSAGRPVGPARQLPRAVRVRRPARRTRRADRHPAGTSSTPAQSSCNAGSAGRRNSPCAAPCHASCGARSPRPPTTRPGGHTSTGPGTRSPLRRHRTPTRSPTWIRGHGSPLHDQHDWDQADTYPSDPSSAAGPAGPDSGCVRRRRILCCGPGPASSGRAHPDPHRAPPHRSRSPAR
jgi:hypothetical protein